MQKQTAKPKASSRSGNLVSQDVKALLHRTRAFSQLPVRTQSQIVRDTTSIAAYLTKVPNGTAGESVNQVDFPDFVAGLINGVFQAIVTYSIDQMKAYAELVANVSKAVQEFSDQNLSDKQARDFLTRQCRDCFKQERSKPLPLRARPATSRQQLLATMVLMGINRIVVTDGRIRARPKKEG